MASLVKAGELLDPFNVLLVGAKAIVPGKVSAWNGSNKRVDCNGGTAGFMKNFYLRIGMADRPGIKPASGFQRNGMADVFGGESCIRWVMRAAGRWPT